MLTGEAEVERVGNPEAAADTVALRARGCETEPREWRQHRRICEHRETRGDFRVHLARCAIRGGGQGSIAPGRLHADCQPTFVRARRQPVQPADAPFPDPSSSPYLTSAWPWPLNRQIPRDVVKA